jgi:hypothetical protein
MVEDLRARELEATVIELSATDEATLRGGAAHAFGDMGETAARAGADLWRSFLRSHVGKIIGLAIEFDADETRVR